MFVPDGPSFSLYVDKVAQQGPDGIVLGEVVFEPGMKSLVGIGRQGPTLDAVVQLRPKLRRISEDTYTSLDLPTDIVPLQEVKVAVQALLGGVLLLHVEVVPLIKLSTEGLQLASSIHRPCLWAHSKGHGETN